MSDRPSLRAVSDLHVSYEQNLELVDRIRPQHPDDWLIVAGDVGELITDVGSVLATLAQRFARVVWVPGNHELWTMKQDPDQSRGLERYERLVAVARELGVVTPEDPYPIWTDGTSAVRVAPLFLLYDYSWHSPGTATAEASLAAAHEAGIVCTDEFFLHPDPFPSRAQWCADRVRGTAARLDALDDGVPLVLVNHWPTLREPTRVMRHQEFVQWCGTAATEDWHTRYDVAAVVYGHLHIPRSTVHDGVPFEEVSIGYPREWQRFGLRDDLARDVLVHATRSARRR